MKKFVRGRNVVPPTTDQTYTVPNARCLGISVILSLSLPWIALVVLGIVIGAGVDVPMPWWLFGVAGAYIGPIYIWLFCKTNKIVLHSDGTVSHINLAGRTIETLNRVPLAKYKTILIDYNRVTYVKSRDYFDECRQRRKRCACFVRRTEIYRINEPIDFATDHGMIVFTKKVQGAAIDSAV
jgi:hypothetical protein